MEVVDAVRARQGHVLSALQLMSGLVIAASTVRGERKGSGPQRTKPSLFASDMIIYIEYQKMSTNEFIRIKNY